MTGVLKKNTGIEISPCDDRSRGWSNAATSRGTPRFTGSARSWKEAWKDFLREPAPTDTLIKDFDLPEL